MKIAYFAVIAVSIILCVVDLALRRYNGAIITGLSTVWLFLYYRLFKVVEGYHNLCAECSKEIDEIGEKLKADLKALDESYEEEKKAIEKSIDEALARERIHKQEFNKMRKRAQDAERKLEEMINDTPTRDKKGRYTPRKNKSNKQQTW